MDRVEEVYDKVSLHSMHVDEIIGWIDHVRDTVPGYGVEFDGLSSQMSSFEEKLSKVDVFSGKMAQLQEAVGMQHLMMVDTNGPIHSFTKLQEQVTEIQKSTTMLEMESDGLHASIKDHVTDQVNSLFIQLMDVDESLRMLHDKANRFEGLEDRVVRLEQKVDGLAVIEKKLDGLWVLGRSLMVWLVFMRS